MSKTRAFYILIFTQALSLIGSRMTSIGVGIYLFKTTGLTTPLLLMAFFNELPGMLGSSFAGVWVDRWDRRKVMLFADLGQAAGSVLLIASFLSGQFQLWQLYVIVFIQGSFSIFQSPAENAAVTMLVPGEKRERANGMSEMAFPFAGVIAPVLAGLIFTTAGITGVLAFDLATFLIAVSALAFIHIPRPATSVESQVARGVFLLELKSSFKFLRAAGGLFALILFMTFTDFVLNGPLDLAIPYLVRFTGSETTLGVLMGIMSLGAFSGALLITIWPGIRPRMHMLLAGFVLNGLMFLVFGLTHNLLVLGCALFLIMLPLPIGNALFISILQIKSPADMQGRIFSIVEQLAFLGSTASFLLTGFVVDRILEPAIASPSWETFTSLVGAQPGAGMRLVLICAGISMLLAVLVIAAWPRVRKLEVLLPDYQATTEG
jgi:DHA3 family macrolide efflux protein-like MFS transporter